MVITDFVLHTVIPMVNQFKKAKENFSTLTGAAKSRWKDNFVGFAMDMARLMSNPNNAVNIALDPKTYFSQSDSFESFYNRAQDILQWIDDVKDTTADSIIDKLQGQVTDDQIKQRYKDIDYMNRLLNILSGRGVTEQMIDMTDSTLAKIFKSNRESQIGITKLSKGGKELMKNDKKNKINHPTWYFPDGEKVTLQDPENASVNAFISANRNLTSNLDCCLQMKGSGGPFFTYDNLAFNDLYPAYVNYYTKIGMVPPISTVIGFAGAMSAIIEDSMWMFALFETLKRCQNEQKIENYNPLLSKAFWNTYKGSDYGWTPPDEPGIYMDQSDGKLYANGGGMPQYNADNQRSVYETQVISNAVWARLTVDVQNSLYMSDNMYELIKYFFEKHFISAQDKPNSPYEYTFWPLGKQGLATLMGSQTINEYISSLALSIKAAVVADPAFPALFKILGLQEVQAKFAGEDHRRDINGCQLMCRQITDDFRTAMMNANVQIRNSGIISGTTYGVGLRVITDEDEVYLKDSVLPDLKHDFTTLANLTKSKEAGIIASALKFKFFGDNLTDQDLPILNIADPVSTASLPNGAITAPANLIATACAIGTAAVNTRLDSGVNVGFWLNRYGNDYMQCDFDWKNVDADASEWVADGSGQYNSFFVKKRPDACWKKYKFFSNNISQAEFFKIMARNLILGKYAYDSQIEIFNAIEQYYAVTR